MKNKAALSLLVLIFLTSRKVQCDFENIKYFLTSHEITNYTNVAIRSSRYLSWEDAEKSIQIKAFGKTFILDLKVYFQREDTEIAYVSKLANLSDSFLGQKLLTYSGYVRGFKNSFVVGSFTEDKLFRGYVLTDEIYCIEPYHEENSLFVYRFKDVIVPGCSKLSEKEALDCSETRYFEPWKGNKPPKIKVPAHRYSLFYDKYFEIYNRLQTKANVSVKMNASEVSSEEKDGGGKNKHDKETARQQEKKKHKEDKKDEDDDEDKRRFKRFQQTGASRESLLLNVHPSDFEDNSRSTAPMQNDLTDVEYLIEKLEEEDAMELQCNVEVVLDLFIKKKFGNRHENILKDIYTQFTLLNKIFRKVTLFKRGEPFHLTLNVEMISIYADEVYSPFDIDLDLQHFTKSHSPVRQFCLVIGFVNKFLKSGQFFDGYIPEGGGGACSFNGNRLIVSHGNPNTPAPMGLFFASLIRGITRALGANDQDTQCSQGTYPNPMQVLQDYLLGKEIDPTKESSIFTTCNIKEIETAIKRKECFVIIKDPLCGNAIVDEGEQCDCGPATRCNWIDDCCNPVRIQLDTKKDEKSHPKGCTLIKRAKCSSSQECCLGCYIEKEKHICYSGKGACDIGMCDGKSASCPMGNGTSEDMICSETENKTIGEPLICRDSKCELGLCAAHDLKPCTCAWGTGRDCLYCCMKDGKCKSAGPDLKLAGNKKYYKQNGMACMGGECQEGKCVYDAMKQILNYTNEKPPIDPSKVNACSYSMAELKYLVASVLSSLFLLCISVF